MLTKKWLKDNNPEDFDMNIVTYYPGSKVYDNAVPSKRFKNYKWEYNNVYFNKPRYSKEDSYYRGFMRKSKSDVRLKEITNKQLIKMRDEIDKELRQNA